MVLPRFVLLSCFVGIALCAVLRTTPPTKQCLWNGKYYAVGSSFHPSPCEFCHCPADGNAMCAIADCVILQCVDMVHDPTKCCPVCPNGPNCQYRGHVIKQGEVYKPDNYTTCRCPSGFHYRSPEAMCAVQAISVPIHAKVDQVVS